MAGEEQEKPEDDKDLELDLMAEQELLRLTRQFRVMEGDKEAYLDEATKALRRQRKIIDDLDREKADLERELKTATSRQNSRRDGENAAKLARLAEEQETFLSSIRAERSAQGDLQAEVTRIERMVAHQRRAAAAKANPIAAMQQQQKEQQQQQQVSSVDKTLSLLVQKKEKKYLY